MECSTLIIIVVLSVVLIIECVQELKLLSYGLPWSVASRSSTLISGQVECANPQFGCNTTALLVSGLRHRHRFHSGQVTIDGESNTCSKARSLQSIHDARDMFPDDHATGEMQLPVNSKSDRVSRLHQT